LTKNQKKGDTTMRNYEEKREKSTTNSIREELLEKGATSIERIALQGFTEKLYEIFEGFITEYIGRLRYERGEGTPIYRNGYCKARNLTIGSGTVKIRVPRTRDGYKPPILLPYQKRSEEVTEMILDLYLHGISTGDYNRFLDKILGAEASLSSSTIQRLLKQWKAEYTKWKMRKLENRYLYVWADGVYPKAGPKDEKMALLVLIGVRENGDRDILTMNEGYRESYESWKDTLKDIKRRGVKFIGMMIGDGIKGLWKAVSEIFPKAEQQRCWVHKMRNVLDKVPKRVYDEIKEELQDIYNAKSKEEAKGLISDFRDKYYSKYPNAVLSLEEGGDRLLTYFKFPKLHWKSIKTTNPIESCFATVKLRTNAARRIRTQESAIFLIYKILVESQKRWRKINGSRLVNSTLDNLLLNKKIKNYAA
jgi:putative transposase